MTVTDDFACRRSGAFFQHPIPPKNRILPQVYAVGGFVRLLCVLLMLVSGAARARGQLATFGGNAQHTGLYSVPAQRLNQIHWTARITLNTTDGYAHYGSPLITPSNTVIVPVRTTTGFQVSAFDGATGRAKYTLTNDYRLPSYHWLPVYQPVLASPPSGTRLYYAGAAGTIYYVENPDADSPSAPVQQCFYTNLANYSSNAAAFNNAIYINTPLTADTNGDVFFAYRVGGTTPPAPFVSTNSGFVRIDPDGNATYVLANTAANDPRIGSDPHNCAAALSNDGTALYVVARGATNLTFQSSQYNYLLGLDTTTLATKYRVFLQAPRNYSVLVPDDSTGSPIIGPDGDVYLGVYSGNTDRGFILHYNSDLSVQMPPSGFGWDFTPAIVPTNMVPGYTGTSSYLLFSKYNNYAGSSGGDGINRIALLDPHTTQLDPVSSVRGMVEMREVLTVISCTPDNQGATYPYAVREWCINTAAVNPATQSIFVPNEDGHLYRWNLPANSLTEVLPLDPGVSEPYVPTIIGPDGAVYTLNGNVVFCCGSLSNVAVALNSSVPDQRTLVVGQPVTFTATVTNLDPLGPAPTGTVTFKDLTYRLLVQTNITLASNVPLTNGLASVTTSSLAAGSNYLGNHFITAIYSGDSSFPTGSVALIQKVHADATALALTSAPAPGSSNFVFSATVTSVAPATNKPTGMVSFWDGSMFLAQMPLNSTDVAAFTNSSFSSGAHAVMASYASDTIFAGSSGALYGSPPSLTARLDTNSGAMLLTFTNHSGAPFTVLTAPDASWPMADWISLGPAIEFLPGQFQFLDPLTNSSRMYQVRSP